jgi:hypothetical protein
MVLLEQPAEMILINSRARRSGRTQVKQSL